MKTLAIDIETYSGTDIKCGTYRYVEDSDFTILMLAFSYDSNPVKLVDMTNPSDADWTQLEWLMSDLRDDEVQKTAFNANFERTCLSKYFGIELPPEQWECTMVRGAMLGLPMSLDSMSKVLKLDEGKTAEGKALIRYFSIPCKPTKTNGGRTRNLPEHDPEKWRRFCDYCRQDVVVEQAIRTKLEAFPMLEQEARLWALDQRINDRGVLLDPLMIRNAIAMDEAYKARLVEEAKAITNLSNPNSLKQLIEWLNEESDLEVDNLRKATVPELLKAAETDIVRRVLEIRQEMSKTSVKKYAAMRKSMCEDMRVRGITQFYGAGRTGRWCLAENTPVLVKAESGIFEKPIQDVLESDLVFDGDNWVSHEGVVFSGDKEVISWDGICASAEHVVYLDSDTSLTLSEAKELQQTLWRGNTQFINS